MIPAMEVIAEILLQALVWLLEIAGEFLLQMVFEGVAELFGHAVKKRSKRTTPMRPEIAALGYALFGALAGGASLWLMPHLFIQSEPLRFVNLIVTPVLSGAVMGWMGSWRRRHDKSTVRLETFAYGFCFAFAMAVVRFAGGR
jgi:hypothetical protein